MLKTVSGTAGFIQSLYHGYIINLILLHECFYFKSIFTLRFFCFEGNLLQEHFHYMI